MFDLKILAINLTRRCNLACSHCYLDADASARANREELRTDEVLHLLDDVIEGGQRPMVVLTGGEPLIRRDLERIVDYGSGRGVPMVVGTNGLMLTEGRVRSLKAAGLLGVGISVDSLNPGRHDRFRGRPGAWERTMDGIDQCRRQGLSFQIHFTVTGENADEVDAVIEFSRSAGARILNVFFLVCTGRGSRFTDIPLDRYEDILRRLIEAQKRCTDLVIRARCAPHFKRVAYELDPESPLNRISGSDGDGCIAGTHYCRVTPEGAVTACPYIDEEAGSIRDQSFTALWRDAGPFRRLRQPQLRGSCGRCEFRRLCGGCRARPVAAGGDLMDADPWCDYRPAGIPVIEPLDAAARPNVCWSPEAEKRLSRAPAFLRSMVRSRAEAYVVGLGETEIRTEHLDVLSARRFGGAPQRTRDA